MAVSNDPERTAVVSGDVRLTAQELSDLVDGGAGVIAASGARHVAYVGAGGLLLPLLIFSSAGAGVAFTPINYRLSATGIGALIERLPDALVIVDDYYAWEGCTRAVNEFVSRSRHQGVVLRLKQFDNDVCYFERRTFPEWTPEVELSRDLQEARSGTR